MFLSVILLSATVYFADASLKLMNDREVDNEVLVRRAAPAQKTPELTRMSNYWAAYARRRADAVDRCDSRLFRYSSRRKQAQELLINIARRNVVAELSDIKLLQQETTIKERELQDCVRQIIDLQGYNPFYRAYQVLESELERLSDQVASCESAGGRVSLMRREADIKLDEEIVSSSSPQMLRVYKEILRQTLIKKAEKKSCFESLAIPDHFPVKLEPVTP